MAKQSKPNLCEVPTNAASESSPSHTAMDTKHRIYQAAFQLFGTRGYSCTSIQDISEAAAVKKSIVYYYFSSKEDLYEALLVESATHLRQILTQGLKDAGLSVENLEGHRTKKKGAEAALMMLAENLLSLARENRDSVRFFLSHIFAVDSDRPPCSAVVIEQVPMTLITTAIEAGVASKELRGKPALLASLVLGGIQVSIIRHLRWPDQEPLPIGLGRSLVRAALDGFRPHMKKINSSSQEKETSDGKDRLKQRIRRA